MSANFVDGTNVTTAYDSTWAGADFEWITVIEDDLGTDKRLHTQVHVSLQKVLFSPW